MVQTFQRERNLQPTGAVDTATAAVMRELLPHRVRPWAVTVASLDRPSKAEIARLQRALTGLKFSVSEEDRRRRTLGVSTQEAIKSFQASEKLVTTGTLTADTVARLSIHAEHNFYSENKHRTRELQLMLGQSRGVRRSR
ncbi:peptidoglycan-binding domain-containing protein [Mesorhizobium sp. M0571]|uniref:peptidoglycan-binding domain-containing protein n=1 Tax=Mesorhizobium sp. M0571 TaxID=2956960 RepID=UPI003337D205